MSQDYYQRLWQETQEDVKKALATDAKIKRKGPYKDLNLAKWLVGHLFMNYVRIVNRLDVCYDQMIHPQKREVVGRLLDLSLGRLLELKAEIVRIEMDDYCFFDDILIELKLTPEDVEIHVPKYYWRDRKKAAEHRAELMRQVYEELEKKKFRDDYLKDVPDKEKDEVWEKYLAEEEKRKVEREKIQQQMFIVGEHPEVKRSRVTFKRERRVSEIDKIEVIQDFTPAQRQQLIQQSLMDAMLEKQKEVPREKYFWEKLPEEDTKRAATIIQKHWRRHWKRLKEEKGKQILLRLWGMARPGRRESKMNRQLESLANFYRSLQEKNQLEYEEALVKVKEKMMTLFSHSIEEDTVDEIMTWFQWYFDESGYLPDFPPQKPVIPKGDIMGIPKKLGLDFIERLNSNKNKKKIVAEKAQKMTALGIALAGLAAIGGSALAVAGHWIGPRDYLKCQMELEKMKRAEKGAGKEKQPKKEQKKQDVEKKKLLPEDADGFQLKLSNFLVGLTKADRDYRVTWMDRDESNNPQQRYVYDIVKEDKCWELSMEIRKAVDEMMILELEILKDALERDKNPKKKRKKKKKRKGKKGGKKKGKKDPTGDRTLDDLFLELFRNGIIRDYDQANLKELLGERSYAAYDLRQRLIDWPPSTGDLRDVILQLCILPLGSSRIHQLSPIVRSVCLVGTENSGKEFLARIICTETASVMFDLTPENISGKYPGKEGLKMLQHLVQKMSRALQPSVIFINGAEKNFYKKVPKEERQFEPKRLARMITKLVKDIKPEDQVLLLGVSSRPWLAHKKKLLKAYQKIIQIPQMDYGSYVWLWDTALRPHNAVPDDFDVSCLAKVSYNYSVNDILQVIEKVVRRRKYSEGLAQYITQADFLEELVKFKPADPKMKQKSLKFYSGLELTKKRAKKLAEALAEIEKAQRKK